MQRKRWYGDVKSYDDFGKPISRWFVDGKTVHGPWAIMTSETHRLHGVGLGIGKGQLYAKDKADGLWYKVG